MGLKAIRLLCLFLISGWLGAAVAQDEAQGSEEAEPVAKVGPASRSGFSTGLGEWALARRYPEQAVWLDLDDEGRALGLFLPEYITPANGALLVLADEGQTANEGVLGSLRVALAERGIAVMTVGLGLPPEAIRRHRMDVMAPSLDDDAGQNPDQGGNTPDSVMIDVAEEPPLDDVTADFRNSVRAVLSAGVEALQQRGYERAGVLGIGWSADYVTDWAADAAAVSAVVWLAPRFPARQAVTLPSLLKERNGGQGWPVLDLHGSGGRSGAEGQARAAAIARADVAGYDHQPVALNQPLRAEDAVRVASRVSAWLKTRPTSRN
ncbi:DUF3530 family protein [Marinobacter nauticus]|jgi:hypothetical protein|uniref:DUF3530 family protein n=1 Tax=Marinobacter nauticus TaxID=2743 RepID=A0A833JTP1_MARNT|nr:DUF3530 family protein [Marinobacter nauticus]KAE8546356.1 hypothetical protein F6453_1098 [Marinobacter nauticus]